MFFKRIGQSHLYTAYLFLREPTDSVGKDIFGRTDPRFEHRYSGLKWTFKTGTFGTHSKPEACLLIVDCLWLGEKVLPNIAGEAEAG